MIDLTDTSVLFHGDENKIATLLRVNPKTVKRWKSGEVKTPEAIRLLMYYIKWGELSGIGGKEWEGFTLQGNAEGKLLFIPGYKYGFKPDEIRSFFFRNQTVGMLESELKNAKHRIEQLEQDLAKETDRAERYRTIAKNESQWGMTWSRITAH